MGEDVWSSYVRLAQQLDAVRRAEAAQTVGRTETRYAAEERITQLRSRLASQEVSLTALARQVRLPRPSFPAPPASPTGTATEALRASEEAAAASEAAAATAAQVATQPLLMPYASTRKRNLVVYGFAAFLGLVAQLLLLSMRNFGDLDTFTAVAWSLCGLPTIAFFIGYLLVGVAGSPRTGAAPVDRTPRLGFALCMAALPGAWLVWSLVEGLA